MDDSSSTKSTYPRNLTKKGSQQIPSSILWPRSILDATRLDYRLFDSSPWDDELYDDVLMRHSSRRYKSNFSKHAAKPDLGGSNGCYTSLILLRCDPYTGIRSVFYNCPDSTLGGGFIGPVYQPRVRRGSSLLREGLSIFITHIR